jgi:hypothetical protein
VEAAAEARKAAAPAERVAPTSERHWPVQKKKRFTERKLVLCLTLKVKMNGLTRTQNV